MCVFLCGGPEIREKVEIVAPLGRNQALGAHMRAAGCAYARMFGSRGGQKFLKRALAECPSRENDEIFDGVEAQCVFFSCACARGFQVWEKVQTMLVAAVRHTCAMPECMCVIPGALGLSVSVREAAREGPNSQRFRAPFVTHNLIK